MIGKINGIKRRDIAKIMRSKLNHIANTLGLGAYALMSALALSACGGGGGGGGGGSGGGGGGGGNSASIAEYNAHRNELFNFQTKHEDGKASEQKLSNLPQTGDLIFEGGVIFGLPQIIGDDAAIYGNSTVTLNLESDSGKFEADGFITVDLETNSIRSKGSGTISGTNMRFSGDIFSTNTSGTIRLDGVNYNVSANYRGRGYKINGSNATWLAGTLEGNVKSGGKTASSLEGVSLHSR